MWDNDLADGLGCRGNEIALSDHVGQARRLNEFNSHINRFIFRPRFAVVHLAIPARGRYLLRSVRRG
jgi:hypothetical protein